MAQHVLSLECPETLSRCIIRLQDTSIYNSSMPVVCPVLSVTLPGFTASTVIDVTPGFNLNLTACDFGVQNEGCGTKFTNLPDGIYIIKYAVSPVEQIFVEYNHLRMTCALNRYYEQLCKIDLAACDPLPDVKTKLEELRLIRMYLDAAKAMVEFCHHPESGMDLYNYALKRLSKFECNKCTTC